MIKAIGYARVSTAEQGKSGLGLEAQNKAIADYCTVNGYQLLETISEVGTGKGNSLSDRIELKQAIERAKKEKAILIVSKIDRLSRSAELVAHVLNMGVSFQVVDLGKEADNFQINLFANFAQKEREKISQRTKEALDAKKARGETIRRSTTIPTATREALKATHAKEKEKINQALELVSFYRSKGETLGAIANKLNSIGVPTARGGEWTQPSLSRFLKLAKKEAGHE